MTAECILAFDVGTSAIKAALVTAEGGILGVSDERYPLSTPRPGWAEQDPGDYWRAACLSSRRVLQESGIAPESVRGIAFSTQWKGIIPVDRDGKVLHPNILWLDARAGEEARQLNREMGCFVGSDNQYWPRLIWFRKHRKECYDRADQLLCVDSYLKLRLTGEATADATNSFIFSDDRDLQEYYDRILNIGALDKEKFPRMTKATDQVGQVTKAAAEALGVCPGTPVFGGCGDIPAIAIGSGTAALGREHIYLGSSGWLARVDDHPDLSEGMLYQTVEAGRYMTVAGMQSACMTQNWAISALYHQEFDALGDGIFPLLESEMKSVPAGAEGLLATPWIHGETRPWSAEAHAMFINLQARHTRAHMFRAIRESVAFHLRARKQMLDGGLASGHPMRIVGGGAQSSAWMQAFADILNTAVEIPHNARHAGAIGAAGCAAVGLGWWSALKDAEKYLRISDTYIPSPGYQRRYDRMFEAFTALYPAVREILHTLNMEDEYT